MSLFVSYLCIAQCSSMAVLNLLLLVIFCICPGNEFQRNAVWWKNDLSLRVLPACCMISCGFLRFGWERSDENGNRWLLIGASGHGAESVWLIWHWCLNFICQAPFIQCVRRVDADEKKRTANSTTKVVKKGRLFKVVLWVKCHLSDFYLNHVII